MPTIHRTATLLHGSALAVAIAVAAAVPAEAQRMAGQAVSTHAYVGSIRLADLYVFEDGTSVERLDGMLVGGQGGFGVTPSVSVMANVAVNSSPVYLGAVPGGTFGDTFQHEVLLWDVNLQLRKPFWHERTFNPLLQVGAGQIRTTTAPGHDTERRDVRTAPAFNAGVGFDLQFGNAFGVRVMAKDYYTTVTWESSADPRFNGAATATASHNLAVHAGITLGF